MNLASAAGCAAVAASFGATTEHPALLFAAGVAWVQVVEYAWHRGIMHGRWRCRIRRSHLDHHRAFSERFQVGMGDTDAQEMISEHPITFPLAFVCHAAVLTAIFGIASGMFLAGVCLGYAVYEIGHWASHVEANPIDSMLLSIPGIARIRRRQIEHHREHHERPMHNFSFTPPYVGDVAWNTKKTR